MIILRLHSFSDLELDQVEAFCTTHGLSERVIVVVLKISVQLCPSRQSKGPWVPYERTGFRAHP
jgi:hypothetical protein